MHRTDHTCESTWRATTVLAVSHNGQVVIGADGQATFGNTIIKSNVKKIRKLFGGKVLAGFAGSTSDALTLLNAFEGNLKTYGGNVKKAAVELAKNWRMDRTLKRLEAMLIVANVEDLFIISGTGDVLEPEPKIAAIGSGSMYAQAAALALMRHAVHLNSREIVQESLKIAADICIYTNHNLVFEEISKTSLLLS